MPRPPIFEWHGKEYAFEEKSADWYWALGILVLAGIVVCVLFSNILLALVIAAAGVTVGLYAAKRPRIHRFRITEQGLLIDDSFYPYDAMLHFSVLEYADETLPPSLSIKTRMLLAPHILIPINDHDPVEVYEYLSAHLPEGEHERSVVDRLVDMLKI